ncbi:hypothetical protein ACFE04_022660 [Oxalis oulophora]
MLLLPFHGRDYANAMNGNFSSSALSNDAVSLLHFKTLITHDPLNSLSNWNLSITPNHCHWYGITCTHSRRVASLNLTAASLSGNLSASITNLTHLHTLSLSSNFLTGELPPTLIGNRNLELIDLSNNHFTGTITILLHKNSQCQVLIHLKLSHNALQGNIPKEIGRCKNLRTLLLNGNNLQGSVPAEIGSLSELRVLDVSRNSLTYNIPKDLAKCTKLYVLVLTNLVDDYNVEEFNAFVGDLPPEILLLPSLRVLWAPRANLHGRLPAANWSEMCSMKVLNLGQNYFRGVVPEGLSLCKNVSFLDLSSNNFAGYLPASLKVPCMVYFSVSNNNVSGNLPSFENASCNYFFGDSLFLDLEDMQIAYTSIRSVLGALVENSSIVHDFSWNNLTGNLPSFSVRNGIFAAKQNSSYTLLLNNNLFNGSLRDRLVSDCNGLQSFSVNLTSNQISGGIQEWLVRGCVKLKEFEAAYNKINGSISPDVGNFSMLEHLELRRNKLSGLLPDELVKLKSLKRILLGSNNLTGKIPSQIGELNSLLVLDLSHNSLSGSIPESFVNASNIETLLLDHNRLSGEIPSSFSSLRKLTWLDLSFNLLSGDVPNLTHHIGCEYFKGNLLVRQCTSEPKPPNLTPGPKGHKKMKTFIIVGVAAASSVLCIFLIVVCVRKKLAKKPEEKVVVTFGPAPSGLSYDSVVQATGNFSIRNLIGTGGFGSTYKAEISPGYIVAVKKLSIGRFQGVKQFDAEIRTLGRIRHKNLVTLVGYFVGEAEMFLIYNYLPGGNLESFLHNSSGTNLQWPVISKIATDIAQALAYLHYSCVPRIVHRDIKPSNILLDQDLNAYLSDFGLAKLLEVSQTHATTDVAGTFGYVAPEYATTCRVSDKADVYSFGIVMLELISGKKSLDPSFCNYGDGFNIVTWARLLIKEGRCSELFSPELWEAGPQDNLLLMLRLASCCTVEILSIRPSMKQVLDRLKRLKS